MRIRYNLVWNGWEVLNWKLEEQGYGVWFHPVRRSAALATFMRINPCFRIGDWEFREGRGCWNLSGYTLEWCGQHCNRGFFLPKNRYESLLEAVGLLLATVHCKSVNWVGSRMPDSLLDLSRGTADPTNIILPKTLEEEYFERVAI